MDQFLKLWKQDFIAHKPRVDRIFEGVRKDVTAWVCLFYIQIASQYLTTFNTDQSHQACIFAQQILQRQQIHSWQHRN